MAKGSLKRVRGKNTHGMRKLNYADAVSFTRRDQSCGCSLQIFDRRRVLV